MEPVKLYEIIASEFKLDGGAMFGVVPKPIWEKMIPANEFNLIQMVSRCLLVESQNKRLLIDTGLGDKQSDSFFNFFETNRSVYLDKALNEKGFPKESITDVLLSHLHFDHGGGAVAGKYDDLSSLKPYFPNARYWASEGQWESALHPNPREKGSYLKENFISLKKSGQLSLIKTPKNKSWVEISELGISCFISYGHTYAQLLPLILWNNQKIFFAGDLMPTIHHLKPHYLMAYDIEPLQTMKEKIWLIEWATREKVWIFLDHDPAHCLCRITSNDKGPTIEKAFSSLKDLEEFSTAF